MEQYSKIRCPNCQSHNLVKNGHSENGAQRYLCNCCNKSFQNDYTYNAWKPGIKEQIEQQTLNSSGIRDISRNLNISRSTVISELKKTPIETNPFFLEHLRNNSLLEMEIEIKSASEVDEFWSYVGNKSIKGGRGMLSKEALGLY